MDPKTQEYLNKTIELLKKYLGKDAETITLQTKQGKDDEPFIITMHSPATTPEEVGICHLMPATNEEVKIENELIAVKEKYLKEINNKPEYIIEYDKIYMDQVGDNQNG